MEPVSADESVDFFISIIGGLDHDPRPVLGGYDDRFSRRLYFRRSNSCCRRRLRRWRCWRSAGQKHNQQKKYGKDKFEHDQASPASVPSTFGAYGVSGCPFTPVCNTATSAGTDSLVGVVDTSFDSHNIHYVNRSVRGFGLPSSRRISSARSGPFELRMRRIIRPRVVAPAIQSAPGATHSVATIAHRAFSLAGTILIPDCARSKGLSPALFPQLSTAPIHSSGRSRP